LDGTTKVTVAFATPLFVTPEVYADPPRAVLISNG
jgi:hypothetical protein